MKRIWAYMVCFGLMLSCLGVAAPVSAEEIRGACGTSSTWVIHTDTGEMVVSGTGSANAQYQDENGICAADYQDIVKSLVVGEGITSISGDSFLAWNALESVYLSDTITVINANAFRRCTSLKTLRMSSHIIHIWQYAFERTAVEAVDLPETLTIIGSHAFCFTQISTVVLPKSLTYIGQSAFWGSDRLKAVIVNTDTVQDATATALLGESSACFSFLPNLVFKNGDFPIEHTTGITVLKDDSEAPIFYAPAGGTVEAYCQKYGFRFMPLNTLLLGDLTDDGIANTSDARSLLALIVTDTVGSLDSAQLYQADLDEDGKITARDCRKLLVAA